jgi:hypothetical protein
MADGEYQPPLRHKMGETEHQLGYHIRGVEDGGREHEAVLHLCGEHHALNLGHHGQ